MSNQYPHGGSYKYGNPNPQGSPGPYGGGPYPPPQPKSNTGRNIAIGCGVVLLIGFLITGAIIAFFALVFTSDTPESTKKSDQDTGISFAGKTPKDVAAPAGSTLTADGLRITATTLGTKKGVFDGEVICSNISVNNESDKTASFNTFDWSLQYPSGVIENWGSLDSGDNALSAGDLAPGGSVSGDVCFDYKKEPGEYVLLYKQSLWDSARYAWVSQR